MEEKLPKRCLVYSEKGMAVVLVLVFTSILMAFGAALITNAVNEKLIAGYNTREIKLYYITEAGIEAGIAALNDTWASGTNSETFFVFDDNFEMQGNLGEGSFIVSFKELDHCPDMTYFDIEIISTGTLAGNSKTMTAIITIDKESLTVTEWKRPFPIP